MPDPASIAFSAIGGTLKLIDFYLQLREVNTEAKITFRRITHIQANWDEARRLRSTPAVKRTLDKMPSQRDWINKTVDDMEVALQDLEIFLVEAIAAAEKSGITDWSHRIKWIFSQKSQVRMHERSLETYHQSLVRAIGTMQTIESAIALFGEGTAAAASPTSTTDATSETVMRHPRREWTAQTPKMPVNIQVIEARNSTFILNSGTLHLTLQHMGS